VDIGRTETQGEDAVRTSSTGRAMTGWNAPASSCPWVGRVRWTTRARPSCCCSRPRAGWSRAAVVDWDQTVPGVHDGAPPTTDEG